MQVTKPSRTSGEERPRFSLLFPAFSLYVLLVSSRHSLLVETKLKPPERATVRVCHEDQRQVHTRLACYNSLVFRHEITKRDTTLSSLWVFEATFNCIYWETLQLEDRTRIPNVESCVPWRFSSHHFIADKSFAGICPYYVATSGGMANRDFITSCNYLTLTEKLFDIFCVM